MALWTVWNLGSVVWDLSAYYFNNLILDGPEIPDHPAQFPDCPEDRKVKAASSLLIFRYGPQISDHPAKIPDSPRPGPSGQSW